MLLIWFLMVSSKRQRSISMPIISIIKSPWFRVMFYQLLDNLIFPFSNRKYPYFTVSFQYPKDNDFTCGSPATFPCSSSSKCRLITLYFTTKWLGKIFCNAQQLANSSKKLLNCFIRYFTPESEPINRNIQNKKILQLFYFIYFRYPKRIPNIFKTICISALTTFKSSIFMFHAQ